MSMFLINLTLSSYSITLCVSAAAGGGDWHSWAVQCHGWHRDQPAGHEWQRPLFHVWVLHRQSAWELSRRLQCCVCHSESIMTNCFHPNSHYIINQLFNKSALRHAVLQIKAAKKGCFCCFLPYSGECPIIFFTKEDDGYKFYIFILYILSFSFIYWTLHWSTMFKLCIKWFILLQLYFWFSVLIAFSPLRDTTLFKTDPSWLFTISYIKCLYQLIVSIKYGLFSFSYFTMQHQVNQINNYGHEKLILSFNFFFKLAASGSLILFLFCFPGKGSRLGTLGWT